MRMRMRARAREFECALRFYPYTGGPQARAAAAPGGMGCAVPCAGAIVQQSEMLGPAGALILKPAAKPTGTPNTRANSPALGAGAVPPGTYRQTPQCHLVKRPCLRGLPD